MTPDRQQDLREEFALVPRVGVALATFLLLQLVPDPESDFLAAVAFLAEFVGALVLTWLVFVGLRQIRPRLIVRWHYHGGRPIESDHLTVTWSEAIPIYFVDVQVSYIEGSRIPRRIAAFLLDRYDDFEVRFEPNLVRFVVEKGRAHLRVSADGASLLFEIPDGRDNAHVNARVTINPPDDSGNVTRAAVRAGLSGDLSTFPHNWLVNVDQNLRTVDLVYGQGDL